MNSTSAQLKQSTLSPEDARLDSLLREIVSPSILDGNQRDLVDLAGRMVSLLRQSHTERDAARAELAAALCDCDCANLIPRDHEATCRYRDRLVKAERKAAVDLLDDSGPEMPAMRLVPSGADYELALKDIEGDVAAVEIVNEKPELLPFDESACETDA